MCVGHLYKKPPMFENRIFQYMYYEVLHGGEKNSYKKVHLRKSVMTCSYEIFVIYMHMQSNLNELKCPVGIGKLCLYEYKCF